MLRKNQGFLYKICILFQELYLIPTHTALLSSYYQTYNRRSQWKVRIQKNVVLQYEMCYMVIPYYFKLFVGGIHNRFTSRWL